MQQSRVDRSRPRVLRPRRLAAILTVAGAVLGAAGCGDTSSDVLPTPHVSPRSQFIGELALTGEVTVQGSFTDSLTTRGETCVAYVRALLPSTTLWVVPSPSNAVVVGGHQVTYTAGVPEAPPSRGYHGPGTYRGGSAIASELNVDNDSFIADDRTTATITARADGGGQLTFQNMVDISTFARESGTVTWRCAG